MIKFGPSGNSESFYNEGHKSTVEAPKWVKERGLDIYEYSFGKGVLMGENTAKLIGASAKIRRGNHGARSVLHKLCKSRRRKGRKKRV